MHPLEQRRIGSSLQILPVWEKITIKPRISEIIVNSNVKRKELFDLIYKPTLILGMGSMSKGDKMVKVVEGMVSFDILYLTMLFGSNSQIF